MPPQPRPVHAGLYHVATGATKPDPFFRDAVDRGIFVVELAKMLAVEDVVCVAFCLLTTHYHAIFDAAEAALPSAMQRLNWHYSRQANKRHRRLGHAVGRRYMAVPLEDDSHFLTVHPLRRAEPRRSRRMPAPAGLSVEQLRHHHRPPTRLLLRRCLARARLLRATARRRDRAPARLRRGSYRLVSSRSLARARCETGGLSSSAATSVPEPAPRPGPGQVLAPM